MKLVSEFPEITFDDVLLLPNKTDFHHGDEDKVINLKTRLSKSIILDIPIVSAPMPGVTEADMAIALGKAGGLGFIHFYQSFDRQLDQVSQVKKAGVKVAAAIAYDAKDGVEHVGDLLKAGADLISVYSWQAYSNQYLKFIRKLKKTYKSIELSAALAVTAEATEELIKAGADAIQVGIGGGSHCTTRLVVGVGRPQLSAVADCYKVTKKHNIPLISETGIKNSGDVPKALAFGANCVMIGGMFTGTDECPGDIVIKGGKKYKYSWGMCTDTAMRRGQLRRAYSFTRIKRLIKKSFSLAVGVRNSVKNKGSFEEGVEGLVPYKGGVEDVLDQLVSGIRRSMWYQGVKDIKELRQKARVVLVSSSTHLESVPRI